MKERLRPCLCVKCSECEKIFMATVICKDYQIEGEFLESLEKYGKKGYNIECLDASEFLIKPCICR